MKHIFCSAALLLIAISCFGQGPLVKQWDKRYGGTKNDALYVILETADNGILLGGFSNSPANGDKTQPNWDTSFSNFAPGDFWIIKTDAAGTKQWDRRFGGISLEILYAAQQTTDGGYILGGPSYSGADGDRTESNRGNTDYWMVKIDAGGNKQWDKRFGGNDYDELRAVQQTTDKGYILGGYSYSDSIGDKTQRSRGGDDYWVIKTDSLGNKQWDKRFGGSSFDWLYAVKQTRDGGYILGGYSSSPMSGDKSQSNWSGDDDYWLVKIDASGNKQWDKRYGGTKLDRLYSLAFCSDGGFLLLGNSASAATGDKTQNPRDSNWVNCLDLWVVKTDSAGNKQWDMRYGGPNFEDEIGNISQTSDGGYLLAGTSYSPMGGDKSENNLGEEQSWIVKIDSIGNKQWDKTILTAGHEEQGLAIETRDGCYLMGNFTSADTAGDKTEHNWGYGGDYWIIKFCDSTRCNVVVDITANETVICASDTTFICTSTIYTSYLWNNGAEDQCITTSLAGNYYVTVTDANGCTAESNHLAITVLPLPPVSISVNGDTLTVNNAVNQQWYLNGSAINGATTDMYIATQGGSYTVMITDSNGCTATSSPVIISGIEKVREEDVVSVYPNPLSAGSCWLLVGSNFIGGTAEVTDADGRTVFKSAIVNPKSEISFDAAKGVYLLRISSGKGTTVRKLVRL